MNILLLGSGGRECAIAVSLAASPRCDKLVIAPGNGGMQRIGECVSLDICDGDAVVSCARAHDCELVVIGPEAPLVAGVADAVRGAGIACFGPGAAGARVEGSKDFSKKLMEKYDLPTASYATFTDVDAALAHVREVGAPIVVKADGLAAGKGVTVASTTEEAEGAVRECFEGRFGDAGATVVIEECLKGPECSLLAFTDGRTVLAMEEAQDHKRALEGDRGPNTGGMGVYSPVPIVTDEEHDAMVEVMERAVAGMKNEGIDYRGCLYGGFMLTAEGPKLLEFNARFGDPETQVVLPRLRTDLVDVMMACATGTLEEVELFWRPEWAVSVVLASKGYPGSYETGYEITGIEDAEAMEGVTVFHAGTKLVSSGGGSGAGGAGVGGSAGAGGPGAIDDCGAGGRTVVTGGGRVLNVTALGATFGEARERAYAACELINFEGKTLRRDIGERAMRGRGAWEI